MTVKRYTPESDQQDGPCSIWMEESAEGHYVTYSDYQKLVAENVALKKYAKIDDYDKCDNCGFESYVMPIETPATDAAIAEIGAKAIDMFAAWQKDLALQSQGDIRHAYVSSVHDANKFSANLRAGRKG